MSRPEVSIDAGVAVGAGGEVLAVLTHSPTLVLTVDVHRQPAGGALLNQK